MARTPTFTLSVGTLVSTSFRTYFQSFVPFTLLAAIILLPWIALRIYQDSDPTNLGLAGGTAILQIVLANILTGAVTYGVVQQLRGTPAGLGDVVAMGMQAFFRVLLTGLVCGVLAGIGFVFLVVPGILAMVWLYAAVPVCVIERKGVVDSMKRSLALTEGSRWPIFGAVLLLGAIFIGIFVVLFFVLTTVRNFDDQPPAWLDITIAVLVTPLMATVQAVCYSLLRQGKENVDLKDLAAVFD